MSSTSKLGDDLWSTRPHSPDFPFEVNREGLEPYFLAKVAEYEQGFRVTFTRFVVFSASAFRALHDVGKMQLDDARVCIVSRNNPSVLEDLDVLTSVANLDNPGPEDRSAYIAALGRIYGKMPGPSLGRASSADTLCVGPEREGRYLGHLAGWFDGSPNVWYPNAKRIHHDGGLVVALDDPALNGSYQHCIIVDGAIASGATLIAVLARLGRHCAAFTICSAHSTVEGATAIIRYADQIGIEVSLVLGHVTSGLDGHFYARLPDQPSKLVVGDLGDMIFGRKVV
jgi:hypothetical protein